MVSKRLLHQGGPGLFAGVFLVWGSLACLAQTTLSCGQAVTGSIDAAGKSDSYNLVAAAGDAVTIRLIGITGDLSPNLQLYGPDGQQLADASSPPLDQTFTTAGTYTLIVSDYDSTGTGSYTLVWQKLNAPCGVPALSCGQATTESLAPGEQVFYSIGATAGDTVTVRTARVSGNISPFLELYDSAGSRIEWDDSGAISATLPASGLYTVIVSDYEGDNVGHYAMVWQKQNGACKAGTIVCGQVATGSIGKPMDMNAFTFSAAPGDQLKILTRYWEGVSSLQLDLYDSSGQSVDSQYNSVETTVSGGGAFSLLISAVNGVDTGGYSLNLNRENSPCALIDMESPRVVLSTPRGGEVLVAGSPYTISWKAVDNDEVSRQQILLSVDGGTTFPTVVASELSGDMSAYEWDIPQDLLTTRGRIQIVARDSAGNTGNAESSSDFAIVGFSLLGQAKVVYQYDAVGQLTDVVYPDGSGIAYEYDAVGNITRVTKTAATAKAASPAVVAKRDARR